MRHRASPPLQQNGHRIHDSADRGSSAIAGWCEWMIGISVEDEARKIRKMQFELKASEPPDPIYWGISSGCGVATLKRVPRADESYARVQ